MNPFDRHLMKVIVFLLFLLLLPFGMESQVMKRETLSSAGIGAHVQAGGKSYFLLQSIGQGSVIDTYTAGEAKVRQGYIQPLPVLLLGGNPNGLEALIWPNPFLNGVVAQLEVGLEEAIRMELFDMSGRLVAQGEYQPENQLAIPLLNLAQGVYFIKLYSGRKTVTKQLIKL